MGSKMGVSLVALVVTVAVCWEPLSRIVDAITQVSNTLP